FCGCVILASGWVASTCGRAATLEQALRVPPLVPEQRSLDTIRAWNHRVVVEAVGEDRYFEFVPGQEQLTPLECPVGEVFDLAETEQSSFALCKTRVEFRLYRVRGTLWIREPLPSAAARRRALRVCASNARVLVLAEHAIFSRGLEGGRWIKSTYVPP